VITINLHKLIVLLLCLLVLQAEYRMAADTVWHYGRSYGYSEFKVFPAGPATDPGRSAFGSAPNLMPERSAEFSLMATKEEASL
jgi:hypothetical protein